MLPAVAVGEFFVSQWRRRRHWKTILQSHTHRFAARTCALLRFFGDMLLFRGWNCRIVWRGGGLRAVLDWRRLRICLTRAICLAFALQPVIVNYSTLSQAAGCCWAPSDGLHFEKWMQLKVEMRLKNGDANTDALPRLPVADSARMPKVVTSNAAFDFALSLCKEYDVKRRETLC